jgi:5-formyltetrahydrofolate cyclo-ligase
VGAKEAAERLFELEPWKSARRIKVSPDAPQRPVRELALRRGITLFIPTPGCAAGFKQLDPTRIPEERIREAAGLSSGAAWAEDVGLDHLPQMDAIDCSSVAVTQRGKRCGKGEG